MINTILAIALFAATVVLGGAPSTVSPRASRTTDSVMIPATIADSIAVILFSSFNVDRLEICSTRGLRVNGSARTVAATTIVAADGAGMTIDGKRATACVVTAPPGGEIIITADQRKKTVRGSLTITRAETRLRGIITMPRRDYLAATLSAEASPNDPMEYLTALSVLQRNYILAHPRRHAPEADICDNTHCQLADLRDLSPRVYEAVDRAMRLTMTADGNYPSYYSVNCGGSTLTPAQVWKHLERGYSNVICNHCRMSPHYRWERRFAADQRSAAIIRAAHHPPFVDDDFKIKLGRLVGFNKVLSNAIDRIEQRGDTIVITGHGFGHRVGFCQEGAKTLASNGWKAEAILRFYFPTATIR
ncbi:MAG: SpoIID/LytB domain-containing protein [Bacteroidota bacterium]